MAKKNNKKNLIIIFGIIFLIIAGSIFLIWYQQTRPMRQLLKKQARESAPSKIDMGKKAAIIIAFKDFRDEEYFKTYEVLFKGEIKMTVVSNNKGIARGADGGEVDVDVTLEELRVDDFDAIVFIGGPGAPRYLDNENSYKIAREAVEKNKILAAICISPTILARAGVLQGKKATVWASDLDRQPIKILEENGAEYVDEKVVQDGKIITANGSQASADFGQKILELLKNK